MALDTNLLLYAMDSGAAQHLAARRALETAQAQGAWGVALASLVEFWSIATRRFAARPPLATTREAVAFMAALVAGGAQLWHPRERFAVRMFAVADRRGVIGKHIFDWQIGLTVLDHGVTEMWTHDRTFRAPPGLRVVDPLA